jgi:protein-S-isoprenylcysteine O-methyltransferase Ste14
MPVPHFLYLRVGSLIWGVWFLSWMAAAFWKRRTVSEAPKSTFRLQLAMAAAGIVILFGTLSWPTPPLWPIPPWAGWTLVALIAIGMAFAWWARIELGALWSGSVERREGHRIVDTGPYALVRHPIYTGLILAGLALAIIKATPLALLGAALIALGFGLKAKVEERFLAAELGEADYAAYRARVPMLVPFLPTRS